MHPNKADYPEPEHQILEQQNEEPRAHLGKPPKADNRERKSRMEENWEQLNECLLGAALASKQSNITNDLLQDQGPLSPRDDADNETTGGRRTPLAHLQ